MNACTLGLAGRAAEVGEDLKTLGKIPHTQVWQLSGILRVVGMFRSVFQNGLKPSRQDRARLLGILPTDITYPAYRTTFTTTIRLQGTKDNQ